MLTFTKRHFQAIPPTFELPGNTYNPPWADITRNIVTEIARLGWENIEGINVRIGNLNSISGENQLYVSMITGKIPGIGPFLINVSSDGVHGVGIAKHMISTYDDNSGSIELYVGDDWEGEGLEWLQESRIHERLYGNPRRTLRFDQIHRLHGDQFKADTDWNRMYPASPLDPKYLSRHRVTLMTAGKLAEILKYLKQLPSPTQLDGFAKLIDLYSQDPVPAPEDFPVLYTLVNDRRMTGILECQAGIQPSRCGSSTSHALFGGKTLEALSQGNPENPDIVYDSFVYAVQHTAMNLLDDYDWSSDNFPVALRLKHLNDVYVIDHAVKEAARTEAFEKIGAENRDRLTDEELGEIHVAVAGTLVSAAKYNGTYEKPVYLVSRPIALDEVTVLQSPLEVVQLEDRVYLIATDESSDGKKIVIRKSQYCKWAGKQFSRTSENNAASIDWVNKHIAESIAAKSQLPA